MSLSGENGSGKSTLAKILAGAIGADAGEILIDGEPRSFSTPREALAAGPLKIAFVKKGGKTFVRTTPNFES